MRRDEDPNLPQPPAPGEEPEESTGQEAETETADDQEAMEPDLGSAG